MAPRITASIAATVAEDIEEIRVAGKRLYERVTENETDLADDLADLRSQLAALSEVAPDRPSPADRVPWILLELENSIGGLSGHPGPVTIDPHALRELLAEVKGWMTAVVPLVNCWDVLRTSPTVTVSRPWATITTPGESVNVATSTVWAFSDATGRLLGEVRSAHTTDAGTSYVVAAEQGDLTVQAWTVTLRDSPALTVDEDAPSP